ncbi:hypothetical protein DMC30DRAFT_416908 [Rhodotorula diobovata]|uniref:t-SNARE coiled-coil homology domain-containing protein n=1 Tax=Rhodotorula diobovata TaxID=5288 RepID=A0A5C5FUX9_9BASI|nr:hypothetical protein DMC30DRAFT_416908 [Rhodotorula diobovata]
MASDDPYFDVKAEVESGLRSLSSLAASLARQDRTLPDPQQREYTLAEIRATLTTIEPDVDELDEAVAAVEERAVARRLAIPDYEVRARRDFVERAKAEVAAIRRQLPAPDPLSSSANRKRLSATSSAYPPSYHTSDPSARDQDERDDPSADFETQHQTILMEQQDRTLTDISGTVGLLREQAHLMGREVFEQNQMIEELDEHVDSTAGRLAKAQRKMDRFVRENNSASNWCIFILMIVLSILLFIILFA